MIRIKVLKLSQILYWAVIIVVSVALIGLIASAFLTQKGDSTGAQPQTTTSPGAITLPEAGGDSSRGGSMDRPIVLTSSLMESGAVPSIQSKVPSSIMPTSKTFLGSVTKWLFGVDLGDPASLLGYYLPVLQDESMMVTAQAEIATDEEMPDKSDVGEHILVEISRITEPYKAKSNGKILIYHTHTYEAYEQNPKELYVEASAKWRTQEEDQSIIGVGNELERRLVSMGYEVVHDKTAFEPPKLGTAYIRSLAMLEKRMAAGEEYAMVIDLHRDAWDQVQEKTMTADVSGEAGARLMMLIGTGEGSATATFSIKPNWKENYKLADALTKAINIDSPGLCRKVMVKTGRYNQHMSENAVLIEVGNNKNTLQEALTAMGPLAKAIDQTLSNK